MSSDYNGRMTNTNLLRSGAAIHAEMATSSCLYGVGGCSPNSIRIEGVTPVSVCPCNNVLPRVSEASLTTSSRLNLRFGRGKRGSAPAVRAVLAEVPARERNDAGESTMTVAIAPPTLSSATAPPALGFTESSLKSTLVHRLWVAFGASCTAGVVAKGVLAADDLADGAGLGIGAVLAYVLGDLATGVYHWGIDNYGDAETPVFGSQIDAFQGHHRRPSTIAKREFSNNIHAIARPAGLFLVLPLLLPSNPMADAFLGVFLGLVIMSQQFHSWAHSKRSQVPRTVSFLQDNGILVSRNMHGSHHRPPYNINYCIVSGMWNSLLDKSRFFLWLETRIFSHWGVAPRNWAEAVASEWAQEGAYFEDGTDIPLGNRES